MNETHRQYAALNELLDAALDADDRQRWTTNDIWLLVQAKYKLYWILDDMVQTKELLRLSCEKCEEECEEECCE